MNETEQNAIAREQRATSLLLAAGWIPRGNFRFERAGKLYDLSAADLSQLPRIEREGLFLD